jgi:hypothetical protein
MAKQMAPQQTELLTSWKEIASYLGKGVRTVQRWELQLGLPVRRPHERTKGVVHATREELDRWLSGQWSPRLQDSHAPVRSNLDLQSMRVNMRQAAELRQENRLLMEDFRQTLRVVVEECRVLSQNIADRGGLR